MFSLPDIRVETGFVVDNPAQDATALILDDATKGLLNTGTLGTSISWTDISEWVRSFTIARPSTRQQGPVIQFQAGTCSIVLDNSDGRFDPDNLDGPYVTGGVSQIDVMVPVRILVNYGGVVYYLYSGFADAWTPADINSYTDYTEITLTATDVFKVLAAINIPTAGTVGTGEDTGARMTRILGLAGWYTDATRNSIDTGNSDLLGTTLGADALSLMQIAVDSEIGQLYPGSRGEVVFRARHALLTDSNSNTVQAVFGDSPGTSHTAGEELNCSTIKRVFDDTTLVNDVQATRVGGTLQEVTDTASITKYLFKRSYERSDLILQNDSDALSWAQWVSYISKDGENRFDSIDIDPFADADNLWSQILGRQFYDRIQIWNRPPNVTDPISKDCFVVGIQHACDIANVSWTTTWILQSADKYGSFLTLDNATTGQLNNNALAY